MWIIILCIVLAIITIIFCFGMARVASRPRVHTLDYEREKLENYEFAQGETFDFDEEYEVETEDGLKLWVGLTKAKVESKKYIILSHGYTSTRFGTYKYAILWKRLGFNCILYENRGHGVNQPATISFGYRESKDLIKVIEDTYNRYGEDIRIGLHGESMGSGLQVMSLAYNPKVDFIVNDCGYGEILPVLRWKVKSAFHMPDVLPILVSPFSKLMYGFTYEEVRPIDHLKENEVPICFVHGTGDTFTHVWHSQKMYEANKGYKELHLYEGSEHACCIVDDAERYQKMLEDFVTKVYSVA